MAVVPLVPLMNVDPCSGTFLSPTLQKLLFVWESRMPFVIAHPFQSAEHSPAQIFCLPCAHCFRGNAGNPRSSIQNHREKK